MNIEDVMKASMSDLADELDRRLSVMDNHDLRSLVVQVAVNMPDYALRAFWDIWVTGAREQKTP